MILLFHSCLKEHHVAACLKAATLFKRKETKVLVSESGRQLLQACLCLETLWRGVN